MRKTVTVYECDHCGAPMGSSSFITVNYKSILTVPEYEGSEFHYCAKCADKVFNFLKKGGFIIPSELVDDVKSEFYNEIKKDVDFKCSLRKTILKWNIVYVIVAENN